ncbi:hypothetical protein PPL_01560 [Heterostelium album PN500]|uniref:Uncharacterized protein n=1 Tax=Heterostelium pallidum (strain ATCC 26659 / Pp 5 / PN500) TaxID=670386 RepID=D3AZU7_HETP5|nr:hypothetical protein PPL_01560 [Heterostelium album PN500]EFA84571.1 hypothetical protein PPL_01560 [Heterostelium album PN500]|eukprot:XP_020436684.1 hypothetical protein PPL_01560 [Heterostelium album PN500]
MYNSNNYKIIFMLLTILVVDFSYGAASLSPIFKIGCSKLTITIDINQPGLNNLPYTIVLKSDDGANISKQVTSDETVFELADGVYTVSIMNSRRETIWSSDTEVDVKECSDSQSAPTKKQIIMIVCLVGGMVTVSLIGLAIFNYIKRDRTKYPSSSRSSMANNSAVMTTQRTPPQDNNI